MKNETAKLDCINKLITFKFNDEIFVTDIKEGDIEDSWNSITDKKGVMFDVNFSWEDEKGCKPSFSVYGLKTENGQLTIDTKVSTYIKVGRANRDTFFKEERKNYKN